MIDWLLAHSTQVQHYAWIGALGMVACWEGWRPRRAPGASQRRWLNNVALVVIGTALAWLCLPVAAVAVSDWAARHAFGALNLVTLPGWIAAPIAFLALDAAWYGLHRASHAWDWLWRLHQIHHADLEIDTGTSLRHHPAETLVIGATGLAAIGAIGAPPVAVMAWSALYAAIAVFNHGNVAIPATLDRWLRRFVVTPDVHRIHHSADHAEANSNLGAVLPWWDVLFGTYRAQPRAGHERMQFGVADAGFQVEPSLWALLQLPLRPAATAGASLPSPHRTH